MISGDDANISMPDVWDLVRELSAASIIDRRGSGCCAQPRTSAIAQRANPPSSITCTFTRSAAEAGTSLGGVGDDVS